MQSSVDAWTSAGIVTEALTKPKTDIAPTQDDLDMPLSDTVKEELDKAWDARYHLVLELRLTPPDALVAREYREVQRRAHQVATSRRFAVSSTRPSQGSSTASG